MLHVARCNAACHLPTPPLACPLPPPSLPPSSLSLRFHSSKQTFQLYSFSSHKANGVQHLFRMDQFVPAHLCAFIHTPSPSALVCHLLLLPLIVLYLSVSHLLLLLNLHSAEHGMPLCSHLSHTNPIEFNFLPSSKFPLVGSSLMAHPLCRPPVDICIIISLVLFLTTLSTSFLHEK